MRITSPEILLTILRNMDTTRIYNHLAELCRVEYRALEGNADISTFTYNGISYDEGTGTYQKVLDVAHKGFKAAILELSLSSPSTLPLKAILTDFKEAERQYWDIPDEDMLKADEQEYEKYHTPSLLTSIREIKFLQSMSEIQKWYLHDAIEYITSLMGVEEDEKGNSKPEESTDTRENGSEKPKIISGVRGLAAYLGCGTTKAQKIINSRILINGKIQYKVGENWKFNCEKLDQFLADNPEVLGRKKPCKP